MGLEVKNEDLDLGNSNGATEATLIQILEKLLIKSREVCDLVEVDISGTPTIGGGYFKNFPVVLKYTETSLGLETIIAYTNYDGSPYSLQGSIQACPQVCCDDSTEATANLRAIFKSTDSSYYLNDEFVEFQEGTGNLEWEVINFTIDNVAQSGIGNTYILSPTNIVFVESDLESENYTVVGINTTENNFENLSTFLNSLTTDPTTKFYPYVRIIEGFYQAYFGVNLDSSRDFYLELDKNVPNDGMKINKYIFSFDSVTQTASIKIISGDHVSLIIEDSSTVSDASTRYVGLYEI